MIDDDGIERCACGAKLADVNDSMCPDCEEVDAEVRREEEANDA
jgi:hypothetical protein